MAKKNDFLARLNRQRATDDAITRTISHRYTLDMVIIALGRLGWLRSAVRAQQFNDMMEQVTKEYAELSLADVRDDKECAYMKYKLDKELKAIVGEKFLPYEERYKIDLEQLKA